MNLSKIINKIKSKYFISPNLFHSNAFEVKFENFTIFANNLEQTQECFDIGQAAGLHSYGRAAGLHSYGRVTIHTIVTNEFLNALRQQQLIGKKENVIIPSRNLVLLGAFIQEIKYSNNNNDHSSCCASITLSVDDFAYIH